MGNSQANVPSQAAHAKACWGTLCPARMKITKNASKPAKTYKTRLRSYFRKQLVSIDHVSAPRLMKGSPFAANFG